MVQGLGDYGEGLRLLPQGRKELWSALGRRGQDLTWALTVSSGGHHEGGH